MTFGDVDVARSIYAAHMAWLASVNHTNNWEGDLSLLSPDLTRIGNGCYRTVYRLGDEDIVYKVGSYGSNTTESSKARSLRTRSLRRLGFDVYIPYTRTFRMPDDHRGLRNAVAVQEYCDGGEATPCGSDSQEYIGPNEWRASPCDCEQVPCYKVARDTIATWGGIDDLHEANVLVTDGVFWPIDMGL